MRGGHAHVQQTRGTCLDSLGRWVGAGVVAVGSRFSSGARLPVWYQTCSRRRPQPADPAASAQQCARDNHTVLHANPRAARVLGPVPHHCALGSETKQKEWLKVVKAFERTLSAQELASLKVQGHGDFVRGVLHVARTLCPPRAPLVPVTVLLSRACSRARALSPSLPPSLPPSLLSPSLHPSLPSPSLYLSLLFCWSSLCVRTQLYLAFTLCRKV